MAVGKANFAGDAVAVVVATSRYAAADGAEGVVVDYEPLEAVVDLDDAARDRVVIFSTHIIEDISSSCNRLAVLSGGTVQFHGSPGDLVELTRGVVWQARVSPEQFEQLRATVRIVHHARDGESIRLRILAEQSPLPDAEQATPTLEDSYLWLVEGRN